MQTFAYLRVVSYYQMDSKYFKAKIGKEEHLKQLQKEGVVYCNTLKYFTEIEDGKVRGDKHENAFEFDTYDNPEFLIKLADKPDSEFKKLNVTWAQMVKSNPNPFGNLYCLYCVDMTDAIDEGEISVDEKNGDFGTHALIFLNTDKFEEILFAELSLKKLNFHYGHVEYIDLKKHKGRKTLFQKDISYSYQNEFRIFIDNPTLEPLILKLGDLTEITTICDFSIFKNLKYKRFK